MIDIVNAIIILSLIVIIYKYFEKHSYDVVMVKSEVNGKTYLVRNLPDKQEASNLLGKIAIKLENLVDVIKNKGYENVYNEYVKTDIDNETRTNTINTNKDKDLIEGQDGGSSENQTLERNMKMKLKEDIERLIGNFNSDAFSETTPDSKYTSYSVNKGEKINFCVRSRTDDKLVKENIMTFVAIHELGHLMTKSIGHDPDFWNNMRLLLKIAIDNGLYKNVDFNKTPEPYCGVTISDTPLKI
jgi:predicted metal-dependent hydrolase